MKIPIGKIREYPCAVRGIHKNSYDYQHLLESVGKYGVLEPITVVKRSDAVSGQTVYPIVHGLVRYHAACDSGLKFVPGYVTDLNDAQIEEAQLIAATHKIDTKPVEIAKAMHRILGRQPVLNLNDMAELVCKTPDWVAERFGIARSLTAEATALVNEGKICLCNAYSLARLRPVTEQHKFLDKALTMQPCEFNPCVQARVKQLREAYKVAQKLSPIEIKVLKPNGFNSKLNEIKIGDLFTCLGAKIVGIVNGHHRAIAMFGDIDMDTKIKIKVVK